MILKLILLLVLSGEINWDNYHYEIYQLRNSDSAHEWRYDPKSLGFITYHFNWGSIPYVYADFHGRYYPK